MNDFVRMLKEIQTRLVVPWSLDRVSVKITDKGVGFKLQTYGPGRNSVIVEFSFRELEKMSEALLIWKLEVYLSDSGFKYTKPKEQR